MLQNKKITIVTRLMGRLSSLMQVIPSWLDLKEVDEIIIVDWGCKQDMSILRHEFQDRRIRIISEPDKQYFDSGKAWNDGIREVVTPIIFTVDCDIRITHNPFIHVDVRKLRKNFYGWAELPSITGTSIYLKRMWEKVGGYHEGFPAYGGEDVDFYNRSIKAGFKKIPYFTKDILYHIPHDNETRMKNFPAYGAHPKFTLKESVQFNKDWVVNDRK